MDMLHTLGESLPDPIAKLGAWGYVSVNKLFGNNILEYEYQNHTFRFEYVDIPTYTMLHGSIDASQTEDGIPLTLLDLKEHDALIDIGAHFGIHTIVMAVQNPDIPVYAFEPNEYNRRQLCRNIAANGLGKQVTTRSEVVSDETGTVTFYTDPSYKGSTRDTLNPDQADHWKPINRKSIAASEFAEKENIKEPFLKIDAEGEELSILENLFTSGVMNYNGIAGVVEAHDERIDGGESALLNFLNAHNFVTECINSEPPNRKIYSFEPE